MGYECEITHDGETWFPYILQLSDFNEDMELNNVRVPYLSLPQIFAEGWTVSTPDLLVKGQYNFEHVSVSWTDGPTNIYGFFRVKNDEGEEKTSFAGMCPDINTFRKISKLLNIP